MIVDQSGETIVAGDRICAAVMVGRTATLRFGGVMGVNGNKGTIRVKWEREEKDWRCPEESTLSRGYRDGDNWRMASIARL
ncbi:hypothetical protein MQM1_027 [Aeromonas phage vB_AsaP_MQM1]|nr:hypothetical protein MQM1_027 [Aeromonas phage vB_AsaP_MQM1]